MDATAFSMVEKLRNTNQYIGGTLALSLILSYYTSHSLQRCQFEEVLRHGPKLVSQGAGTGMGVFFFWTHFRLSLWITTYLRMRCTTPPVYLEL